MAHDVTGNVSKNIVVCCDGSGQKLDVASSNVVRLFQALDRRRPDLQIAYYDPGIGTMPAAAALTPVSRRLTRWAGLIAGFGVLDNVAKAYGFIIDNYQPGDRICLVGFSRGALTVRLIGGLLHRIGVLRRDARNLIPYALELYGQHLTHIRTAARRGETRKVIAEFREIFAVDGKDPVDIAFLGVWDTVKAFGIFWPKSFPHMRHNPSIKTVRHAVALDEHRASYMFTSWGGLAEFIEAPSPPGQSVKEVWFAGDHRDVGGGHPVKESGLSWHALRWMVGEAAHAGLVFCDARRATTPPKCCCRIHRSRFWWRLLDRIPRPDMENAPARSRQPEVHLEAENDLPVPPGWPKHRFTWWPDGTRHPADYRRDGPLLLHASVRPLVEAGRYRLESVSYVEDEPLPTSCTRTT